MEVEIKYNVYIVHTETDKAEALIGSSMTEERAERRVETGYSRINHEYDVEMVIVESVKDLKYKADLIKK